MSRVQRTFSSSSLQSYNCLAFTVPRCWFIILITAAYFCECFSTFYFAGAYLWWWTVHKFWYSCLNVLVQVVLFFTNKTILWKQHASCLKGGHNSRLPASPTDCWMVQAVLRAGMETCSHMQQHTISPNKTGIHKALLLWKWVLRILLKLPQKLLVYCLVRWSRKLTNECMN